MSFFNRLSKSLLGITAALAIATPSLNALALTKEEVDAVAWQVSVLVGPGLSKGDVEALKQGNYKVIEGWENGSGVIVGRQGNTYYVVTALHVLADSRGGTFGVATPDGEVHEIDDYQTQANIIPLGKPQELGAKIEGFDLALIKFQSNKKYPVATIGNSNKLKQGEPVFVNGWPNPTDLSVRSRERVLSPGTVAEVANSPFANGGYSLLYSNWTRSGMSGGPVFNSDGEVIGIHGRGRSRGDTYCVDPKLSLDNSCGMQMIHFLNQGEVKRLNLSLIQTPVPRTVIEQGLTNQSQTNHINDIYKLFSFGLQQQLSDCPTSLLTNEPDCN
jgi:S1-C subfamily serine protease